MTARLWIMGIALTVPLCLGPAAVAAGGDRAAAEELLGALRPLEAMNGERPAGPRRQAVLHELGAARRQLQRAGAGSLSYPLALTGVLGNLAAMARENRHDGAADPALRGRFSAQVEELGRRVKGALSAAGPPYPTYGLPPTPPPPAPPAALLLRRGVLVSTRDVLPPPAFQGLLTQLQQLAFGDEKIRLARDAAKAGARLSCRQIAQLMATTSFGDEQVEIAAALYPQAEDPAGFAVLLAALSHPADRDRLRQLVGPKGAR